jgi:hypothetical protein
VRAIGGDPGGDLWVGGRFALAGATPASNLARWNGSSWSSVQSGVDGDVAVLLARPGAIFAGGHFSSAADQAASFLASFTNP